MRPFISILFITLISTFFLIPGCESSEGPDDEEIFIPPDPPQFSNSQIVFEHGPEGTWDDNSVGWCAVLPDGDTLRMWYSANSTEDEVYKIGYAWSVNGAEWNRYDDNIVLEKSYAWEGDDFGDATVIKDGNEFRMWYHGWSGVARITVGYATSPDGKHWTKHAEPIISKNDLGQVCSYCLCLRSVHKTNGMLTGWYHGVSGDWRSGQGCIGYLTSVDGINWENHGLCLHHSGMQDWEKDFAVCPVVVESEVGFEMFYVGYREESRLPSIGYAASEDGITWHKYEENPIIHYSDLVGIPGNSASLTAAVCDWPEPGVYHLWYHECSLNGRCKIRYIRGERPANIHQDQ